MQVRKSAEISGGNFQKKARETRDAMLRTCKELLLQFYTDSLSREIYLAELIEIGSSDSIVAGWKEEVVWRAANAAPTIPASFNI